MTVGKPGRLAWILTALILVAGAVFVYMATTSVGRPSPVAQICTAASTCSSPTASGSASSAGPNTPGSKHSPAPGSKSTPGQGHTPGTTNSPGATASPTAAASTAPPPPPPAPACGTCPPAAAGYFGLAPAGSTSLPSDAQCAAAVHYSTWEIRPQNYQQNHTMPAPGAMAASFAARPRAVGGTYNPVWDSWLMQRVDGRFTGTTDEIFQWAACKWGLPDNLIRADAVRESTWFQYLHFQNNAGAGGGGGSCYWDYGCGDSFSGPSAASATYCNSIAGQALLASEVHNYQADPKTTAGAPPYTPTAGMCPQTFSILGVMSWEDPAWRAPFAAWPGNQNGTFPFTRDSTAAAADYWGAYIRGCYNGWEPWLGNTKGDLWGCIGSWFSGDWHSSAANGYISRVQSEMNNHTWLTGTFANWGGQFSCDPNYGCPT